MPTRKRTIPVLMVSLLLLNAVLAQVPLAADAKAAAIATASWTPEGLQAWGDHELAVDFGVRGLWSYNGVWIQLSRLDPQSMASWGGGRLAINFGAYGLWTYDGQSWLKISSGHK